MREIKFRAWDDNKMIPPFGLLLRESPKIIDKLTSSAILMQFTGLRDKNGKEIYEGDILQLDKFFLLWVVEWYESGFYVRNTPSSNDYYPLTIGLGINREVIGNIYENPELLKGI